MIENNVSLENIADIIKTKNNILIISHVRPDGDTLACVYESYDGRQEAAGHRASLESMGNRVLYGLEGYERCRG